MSRARRPSDTDSDEEREEANRAHQARMAFHLAQEEELAHRMAEQRMGTPPRARRGRPGARGRSPPRRDDSSSPETGKISPEDSPRLSPREDYWAYGSVARRGRRGLHHGASGRERPKEKWTGAATTAPVKKAKEPSGREIPLITNYFNVVKDPEWSLWGYRTFFTPSDIEKHVRKAIIRSLKDLVPQAIYDGVELYTPRRIRNEAGEEIEEHTVDTKKKDGSPISIQFVLGGKMPFEHPAYQDFYNVILRTCLFGIGLEDFGKGYFDPKKKLDFPGLKVQLWPGYIPSMKTYQENILLCIEITHKVIRTDNVLQIIQALESSASKDGIEKFVNNALKDSIVITVYNHIAYRIVEVDFKQNPNSTFETRSGDKISYKDYYEGKHGSRISNLRQPLLLVVPMKKERKFKDQGDKIVMLVPELCMVTGLTDTMRQDYKLMKELGRHLHMGPKDRINAINAFMNRVMKNTELVQKIGQWGLRFDTNLLRATGRVLPVQQIMFANGDTQQPNDQMDWSMAFRGGKKLLDAKPLSKWVLVVPKKFLGNPIQNLIRTMQKVAGPLGFKIEQPLDIIPLTVSAAHGYVRACDDIMVDKKYSGIQLIFIVLMNNSPDVYGAVKKRLVVDMGVSSQCFLAKNLDSKGLMSICTKMVIQMSAKIGGEPWTVKIPLSSMMVIGYDVYGPKRSQTGSMVASLSPNFTKYFSTMSMSGSPTEQVKNMPDDVEKCLVNYREYNGRLPDRIVMYRGGIEGDRDNSNVPEKDTEVFEIQETIYDFYKKRRQPPPKFTFILVAKKITTRFFAESKDKKLDNPPPGTVLDHTITTSYANHFYLTSAMARQGSVSPCSYMVEFDNSGMDDDKLQLLTYKLCHMYFNWSGTVAVPAPVQYARKLAALSAMAYQNNQAHPNLRELLYYL